MNKGVRSKEVIININSQKNWFFVKQHKVCYRDNAYIHKFVLRTLTVHLNLMVKFEKKVTRYGMSFWKANKVIFSLNLVVLASQ